MFLEQLPFQDKEKKIEWVKRKENFIEVGATNNYLLTIDPDAWFEAFKEHYNKLNGSEKQPSYETIFGPLSQEIIIHGDPIINFKVDLWHYDLKFFYEGDRAEEIIYSFIGKLQERKI